MMTWIAFDADDTLWENEIYYQKAQDVLQDLLKDYCSPELVNKTLLETEIMNVPSYGYGIKSFGLSMIETALLLSDKKIDGDKIQSILEIIKEMINTPIALLPDVFDVMRSLSKNFRLMVITKGDLLDQERKFINSQLSPFVEDFEVVNKKEMDTYRSILSRLQIPVQEFMMVGNSLRSDVLPVAAIGGIGVLIHHHLTWEHEKLVNSDLQDFPYYEIDGIKHLPGLIEKINLA
ncbi:MAG: HAD family hydrolase [Anaerolineaceae bacterium]|nr:HAD family hydrolase [Anaerolineaceae bacterium]